MFPKFLALMLPGLVAGALSAACCAILLRWRDRLPHDAPNARSLHGRPVPRVGGLAIWTGFVHVAAWWTQLPGGVFTWMAWCALLLVSLGDDYRGLSAATRLAVHAGAALLAAWGFARHGDVSGGGVLLIALALAWSANLFNFMDGSDGLAAAMTITGFGAYAVATATMREGPTYAALVMATVSFAVVNVPPARMFMGDAGAVPLGFLAAACGVAGWLDGVWPLWFPLLAFLPFVADASLTLGWRLLRGERVWEAHRDHYYQRLNRLGAGHGGTLAVYAAVMLATASSAVLALRIAPTAGWFVLVAWCVVLGIAFSRIDYHWGRRQTR